VGLLAATAVLWSLGGLLIKSVDWNPAAIAGTRSAIAAALLWVILRRVRFEWSWSQFALAASYAGTVILFVSATKLTTAANAILLQYTAPVWVAVFGRWFLGEKARLLDWLTILAVFAGMGVFFLDTLSTTGSWGNLIAIASGVCFAWLVLFMRRQKHGSTLESILLGNLFTALVCLPAYFKPGPNPEGWLTLSILGLFQLGLSYILFAVAIRSVTAIEAILVPVIEPILNPLWVLLFIGERPGRWALLGGFVVLSAITARSLAIALRQRAALGKQ
jgi:drug/metabolite transporter (DMT)-like permease